MTHLLLVKILIFNVYLLLTNYLFYLLFLIFGLSTLFLFTSIRYKFPLFAIITIIFSILGFIFNLDGIMLIFLLTEFTIILMFFMTYLQLYSNFLFVVQKRQSYLILLISLPFIFYDNINISQVYYSFYSSIQHIVSSDFFILYYVLFINCSELVLFITIILTFFSLFFILLYFFLKETKNSSLSNIKNLFFLRKQTLIKQTNFSSNLNSFQL